MVNSCSNTASYMHDYCCVKAETLIARWGASTNRTPNTTNDGKDW
jgi:hypothetical protein